MIPSLSRWLSRTDPLASADVIFVLAGRENRKLYSLELFRDGYASQILFSVARFEIRKFSKMALPIPLDLLKIAADVPAPQRHYFVLFEDGTVHVEYVHPGEFGTLTEIEALARWLRGHPKIKSVLVVSSGTHLRRLRMCCRKLLESRIECRYIATKDANGGTDRVSFGAASIELFKVVLYALLLAIRIHHRVGEEH